MFYLPFQSSYACYSIQLPRKSTKYILLVYPNSRGENWGGISSLQSLLQSPSFSFTECAVLLDEHSLLTVFVLRDTHITWSPPGSSPCYRRSDCYSQICSVLRGGLYLLLECVACLGHINDTQCGSHPVRCEKMWQGPCPYAFLLSLFLCPSRCSVSVGSQTKMPPAAAPGWASSKPMG